MFERINNKRMYRAAKAGKNVDEKNFFFYSFATTMQIHVLPIIHSILKQKYQLKAIHRISLIDLIVWKGF